MRINGSCPCGAVSFTAVIRLDCVEQKAQLKPTVQVRQHSALPWLNDLQATPGFAAGRPKPA